MKVRPLSFGRKHPAEVSEYTNNINLGHAADTISNVGLAGMTLRVWSVWVSGERTARARRHQMKNAFI